MEVIPLSVLTRSEARYLEKQRTTRIIAAKSLLEEELAKPRPSSASIATFRAAAYGNDGSKKDEGVGECLAATKTTSEECETAITGTVTLANIVLNGSRGSYGCARRKCGHII